uniref:DUF1173 domain-containing protein n=1 Tax=Bosea sp. NBC_00436 TaxID=2969620 RepID=A0A9E8CMG5_9HYPH
MLIVRKQSRGHGIEVSEAEIEILKKAYGKFSRSEDRAAGAEFTKNLSIRCVWLACGCRVVDGKRPLLFPVKNGGIQREDRGHGVDHDEYCEFYRDPTSQTNLLRSYGRELRDRDGRIRFRLASQFQRDERQRDVAVHRASTNRSRPGLARLLLELLAVAGLDRINMGEGRPWKHSAQLQAIRNAAVDIDIARGVPLSEWLALSLGEFQSLKRRIGAERADWDGARPHGIFVCTFDKIENGWLIPGKPEIPPIRIEGTLSIFGERNDAFSPPYLVIGLVTKDAPEADEAVVVRAYAHPCVEWSRLTLVDSQLERETLDEIVSCRDWISQRFGIAMTITKPLFDVGQPVEDSGPRELCLPDFVIHATGQGVHHPTTIVETMGYSDVNYRDRKKRLRPLFEEVSRRPGEKPTPIVEHDRFRTDTRVDPDRRFWLELRWAVTELEN